MSQQEQDAIVGRLVREKNEALRLKAALDAEMNLVFNAIEPVIRKLKLSQMSAAEAEGALNPARKYLSMEALMELLQSREEAYRAVTERTEQLKALGV